MSSLNSEPFSASPRSHLVVFLICLALGFIFTLPGSLHPGAALLGYPGDNFQHAWFLWHFAKAVVAGQNPFYTNLIFYPNQVNLAWSTTDPLAGTLALPLSLAAGPILAYNLSLILQLALGAFFARLLCLRICRDEAAALVGGIVFGFSPFLLAHALGHLSLVTAFPIPLYALALARILDGDNPSWRDGVLLGVALLLTALAHYNYTVFCLMLTVVILAVDLVLDGADQLKTLWVPLSAGALTFLIGVFPILRMLVGSRDEVPSPRSLENVQKYSADVFGFLIPSWNHIFFGRFAQHLDPKIFTAGFEGTVYIGPVILILAFVGFARGMAIYPRWTLRATVAAAVFYLLSLGPRLRLFGRQSEIPGPALLLYETRFARFLSSPARFDVFVMLCVGILCAIGCTYLLSHWSESRHNAALLATILALLLADLLTVPFPNSSSFDTVLYPDSATIVRPCELPSGAQTGTVLTLPLQEWPYNVKAMAMQMADDGRYNLMDGYVSYGSDKIWSEFQRFPILRSLIALQNADIPASIPVASTPDALPASVSADLSSDRESAAGMVRDLHLGAIVVFDSQRHELSIRYLEDVFGQQPLASGTCSVFEMGQAQTASVDVRWGAQ
jgi:hypothetical protein